MPASTASAPSLPATFRPRLATRVLAALAVLVLVGLTALAAALPGMTTRDRMVFVIFALLVVVGLGLLGRPCVRATTAGLEIVNVWSTHRLGWTEVVSVRLSPGDPWLVLDLDDGSTLAAWGVQSADGDRGRHAAAQIAALVAANSTTPRDD